MCIWPELRHYSTGQVALPPRQLAFFAAFGQLRGTGASPRLPINYEAASGSRCDVENALRPQNAVDKECPLMKILTSVLLTTLVLAPQSSIPARANDKRPSLPTIVVNAKTIYVENHTTSAELQNTAYTELAKWGRFQVVDMPQKADIALQLSNGNYVKFVPGGESPAACAPKAGKQNWVGADEGVPPAFTRVSLIDPKSGDSLWSDVRKTDSPKAATHILDSLRAAFDQK